MQLLVCTWGGCVWSWPDFMSELERFILAGARWPTWILPPLLFWLFSVLTVIQHFLSLLFAPLHFSLPPSPIQMWFTYLFFSPLSIRLVNLSASMQHVMNERTVGRESRRGYSALSAIRCWKEGRLIVSHLLSHSFLNSTVQCSR